MHFQSADCWTNSYVVGKTSGDWEGEESLQVIQRLASENAVLIFSASSCCMCHAVKRLLCGMGVNPTAYELDEQPRGKEIEEALLNLMGMGLGLGLGLGSSSVSVSVVPVVFIGGKLLGSMDAVMASHINGTLVPLLKEAGALWL